MEVINTDYFKDITWSWSIFSNSLDSHLGNKFIDLFESVVLSNKLNEGKQLFMLFDSEYDENEESIMTLLEHERGLRDKIKSWLPQWQAGNAPTVTLVKNGYICRVIKLNLIDWQDLSNRLTTNKLTITEIIFVKIVTSLNFFRTFRKHYQEYIIFISI